MIRRCSAIALAAMVFASSALADPTIEQIIAGIEMSEKRIHRVHVDRFEAIWFERLGDEQGWKPTPMIYKGSAWYDVGVEPIASDWARGRVWFDKMTMEWVDGTAPFVDNPVDLAFDGKVGGSVSLGTIRLKSGRTVRDNVATLTSDRPILLRSAEARYASGIGFSTQFFIGAGGESRADRPRQPLSQMLREAVKADRAPTIATERVNDVDATRLRWEIPGGMGSSTFWLDAARGYALVRYEMRVNVPPTNDYELIDVTQLKEVAPGVWFPIEGSREMSVPGSENDQRSRITYKVKAVTVNDDVKWDETFFTPKIPAGFMVTDTRDKDRVDFLMLPDGKKRTLKAGDVMPTVKVEDPRRPE